MCTCVPWSVSLYREENSWAWFLSLTLAPQVLVPPSRRCLRSDVANDDLRIREKSGCSWKQGKCLFCRAGPKIYYTDTQDRLSTFFHTPNWHDWGHKDGDVSTQKFECSCARVYLENRKENFVEPDSRSLDSCCSSVAPLPSHRYGQWRHAYTEEKSGCSWKQGKCLIAKETYPITTRHLTDRRKGCLAIRSLFIAGKHLASSISTRPWTLSGHDTCSSVIARKTKFSRCVKFQWLRSAHFTKVLLTVNRNCPNKQLSCEWIAVVAISAAIFLRRRSRIVHDGQKLRKMIQTGREWCNVDCTLERELR